MKKIKDYLIKLSSKIRQLPIDLKLFFWFSAVFFLVSMLTLIFAHHLYEKIIPYTGGFALILYGAIAGLIIDKISKKPNAGNPSIFINIRYKVVFFLGVLLILGVYDWWRSTPDLYTHTNPYLRYDPLQPVFAICMPLLLILIFVWTLMRDLFRKKT